MSIKLKFYGAAEEVTGSCIGINYHNGKKDFRLLLDCGLFQGNLEESFYKNSNIPSIIKPDNIDMILVTHPHNDHCGNIPYLMSYIKKNIRVICHKDAIDILPIIWDDGLKIHKETISTLRSKYKNKKDKIMALNNVLTKNKNDKKIKNKNLQEQLYNEEDIQKAKESIYGIPYDKWVNLCKGLRIKFINVAHTLGSAGIVLEYMTKNKIKRLFYTGDVGSKNSQILDIPNTPNVPIDYLITESTYGDRIRNDSKKQFRKMIKKIEETLTKGGKVIVPAFAFQRSQEFLMQIYNDLIRINQKLGINIPIYMDSPMAIKINKIFKKHLQLKLEEEISIIQEMENPEKNCIMYENLFSQIMKAFSYEHLYEINDMSLEEKKEFLIDLYSGSMKDTPAIIISSSGMCDNGPIIGHLKYGALSDSKNLILFIGFNAENTRGKKIENLQNISYENRYIPIHGENIKVNAKIFSIDCFSAHADQQQLMKYIRGINFVDRSESKIYIIHGDEFATQGLKNVLIKNMAGITEKNIIIPKQYDEFKI